MVRNKRKVGSGIQEDKKIGQTQPSRTGHKKELLNAWQTDDRGQDHPPTNGKRRSNAITKKIFCIKGEKSDEDDVVELIEVNQFGSENKTHTDCGSLSLRPGYTKKTRLVIIKDISWTPPTRLLPANQLRNIRVCLKILSNEKEVGSVATPNKKSATENPVKFKGELKIKLKKDCPKTTALLCVYTTKLSKKVFRKHDKLLGRVEINLDSFDENPKQQQFDLHPCESELRESLDTKSPKETYLSRNKEAVSSDNNRGGHISHKTGIKNLGNTCYANSVLQVLGKTPQLNKCLGGYHTGSAPLLKAIVDELNTNKGAVNSDNVKSLLSYVFERDDSFVLGHQNDSHAFLLSLLDCIKNDSGEESCRLFSGKIRSRFNYSTCTHVEHSDEQLFHSLLMPINEAHTLDACINAYSEEEIFPDNILSCRVCQETKADTVTYKKIVFTELPEILVLQIGRFEEHMGYRGKTIQKNTTRISFEENIRLYLETSEESEKNVTSTSNKTMYCYELYGVVNHSGSIAGGHYTATVKMERSDRWFYCSDTSVTPGASPAKQMDGGAYLLFYQLHHEENSGSGDL